MPSRAKKRSTQDRRARVLVLDDHDGSREVMRYALEARGFGCILAADIGDAFASIKLLRPLAVVYEWRLSSGTATGFATKIRATSPGPRLVIVVSTLNEPEGFRTTEPIDAYFTKPLDMDALVAVLRA